MIKNNDKKDNGLKEAENKIDESIVLEKNGKKETVILNKEEFEQLRAEAEKAKEYLDKMLRQQADFENIRKRIERDKQEFQKFANEDIIIDLLNILDDLERSVEAAEKKQENFEAFLKGTEMILSHFYDLIKKRGVTPVNAVGKKFDPNEQEALMQTETSEHEDGFVMEELQKGYRLNGRVLRTAKVRVAKKV